MANKYMKRCTASLIIKMQANNEILLHTHQDDHYYKKETNKWKKQNKTKQVLSRMWRNWNSTVSRNVKWCNHNGK